MIIGPLNFKVFMCPSRLLSLLLVLIATAAGTAACGSKTHRQKATVATVPPVNTEKLAVKAFDGVKSKTALDEDRRADAYIICVAEEIIHDIPGDWEIAIFRKTTPFLYVLPGRKIGVNSGVLRVTRDQHQLAAVLAHGLAHMTARHIDKRIEQQLGAHPTIDPMRAANRPSSAEGQLVLQALGMESEGSGVMPFDAAQEAEANALGLDLMARAGFNPRESLSLWRGMDGKAAGRWAALAAVHPSYGGRMADLENHMETALKLQQETQNTRKKPNCDRLRP